MINATIMSIKRLVLVIALVAVGMANAFAAPILTFPTEEDILDQSVMEFSWDSNETAVTQWWLYVGDGEDSKAYFDSGDLELSTSVTVTGIPMNQESVTVTLWYLEEGVNGWQRVYSDIAVENEGGGVPEIVFPLTNQEFVGDIEWHANGAAVQQWWLYLGVQPRGTQFYNSGPIAAVEDAHFTPVLNPTPLPVTIYATLWYRINGVWDSIATPIQSRGIIPIGGGEEQYFDLATVDGSTDFRDSGEIYGTSPLITLSDMGSLLVSNWWVYVGDVVSGNSYFDSDNIPVNIEDEAFSVNVETNGLPADGSDVVLTVWYQVNIDGTDPDKWFRQTFELVNPALPPAQAGALD